VKKNNFDYRTFSSSKNIKIKNIKGEAIIMIPDFTHDIIKNIFKQEKNSPPLYHYSLKIPIVIITFSI